MNFRLPWKKSKDDSVKTTPPAGSPTPAWLQHELRLPPWASVKESQRVADGRLSIVIEADTDAAVREWLQTLGVVDVTQYWLEIVFQCVKLDLQLAIENTEYDPRRANKAAEFKLTRAPQWRIASFPRGEGVAAAVQEKAAREHYKRVRGRMPFAA